MQTERSPSSRSSVPLTTDPYLRINLHQIIVEDELNGRLTADDDSISILAADIHANGLLHPITVTPDDDKYTLIAGRRRLAAVEKLRWQTIPAAVVVADETKAATLRFLENSSRCELSPVEEARQLASMIDIHGTDVVSLAKLIGRREEWILDRLEMIDWPEELMYAVHNKQIPLGAAQRLARIQPDPLRKSRIEFAKLHGINIRTAQLWLSDSQSPSAQLENVSLSHIEADKTGLTTETKFHCTLCRGAFELVDTVPARLCSQCLSIIKKKQEPDFELIGPYENYPGENKKPDEPITPENQHNSSGSARHPQ
ncbi:MAG: ParB/RepB/Spo0J family partition protein [Actinomycetota bacterium]|nr:ParB/RepB/Spo0J family partition protein [Actinomycetota bacterium]